MVDRRLTAMSIAAALLLCLQTGVPAAEPVEFDGSRVHPTRVIARLKPDRAAPKHSNVRHGRTRSLVGGLVVMDDPEPHAAGAPRLRARLHALQASGDFEFVEPDFWIEPSVVPSDSALGDGQLWGLRNTGQSGGVAGIDINAVAAWDLTRGSSNVIVAIIDTGIRYTHQDLAAQMWQNPGEIANNGTDDDGNGYVDDLVGVDAIYGTGNPFDTQGHGTHVAGTIGAAADNGHPHVGVAPNVRLMACRFLGPLGGFTSDAMEAINYAVRHGARILNASWGSRYYSQALYDTISAARDAGVLFVASAGNNRLDTARVPNYPAAYDIENILSVAAIDRTGALAWFSSFGNNVHLGAPGVEIYSSYSGSDSSYRLLDGTSMAAPHVAGVAALVWSAFPAHSAADVRRRLLAGTRPTISLSGRTVTGGRVDAYNALTATEDGLLEVAVAPVGVGRVIGGSMRAFVVRVSDLRSVTNATVTAAVSGGAPVTFRNDGAAPDARGGDDAYTGSIAVPASGTNLMLIVSLTAPGFSPTNLVANFPVLIQPANDDFESRFVLAGNSNRVSGNNLFATRQEGEPLHAGRTGKHSMWWSWTAPADGYAWRWVAPGQLQYLSAVYTGHSVDTLFCVAAGTWLDNPSLRFPVRAGETYHIAFDGYRDSTGDFAFDLVFTNAPLPGPPNDYFSLRQPIVGLQAGAQGTNSSATREPLEPRHAGLNNRSIWWKWTAPTNCRATFEVAASFGIVAAVFVGDTLHELNSVGETQSTATNNGLPGIGFNAAAGREYQLLVDSLTNQAGAMNIEIRATSQARPANDDFAAAMPLASLPVTATGTLAGATWERGEPRLGSGLGSVWWKWTAQENGAVVARFAGASNIALAVYSGTAPGDLTPVEFETNPSTFAWRTAAGEQYHLAFTAVGNDQPDVSFSLEAVMSPFLLAAPGDRTVLATRTLRLVAETAGTPPLFHQWMRDGLPLAGQTNATLTIRDVTALDAGGFTLHVSNALGSVTSTVAAVTVQPFAPTVGLFANTEFVQFSPDPLNYGEVNYLAPAIGRIGYPLSLVTNLDDIRQAAVVMPNFRRSGFPGNVPPSVRSELREFVRDGGVLLVTGSWYQRDAELIEWLFGFEVASVSSSVSQFYQRTLQADGTPFAAAPDQLESQSHAALTLGSLPAESLSFFENEDRSLAALMKYGDGAVVFLGPFFLGVQPLGSIDNGWLALLEAGLRVSAPPLDRAPVPETPPASRFAAAGTSFTLSATAYGTAPISFQWYRGEEALAIGTNAAFALNNASVADSGFYYVVLSNAFGVVTSDVARVVIASTNERVVVFDDPRFVRTLGGATNESDALQASIQLLGYGVETIASFSGLLAPILAIPSLANGDLAASLAAAEAAALSNYVATGGALLLHGDRFGHDTSLLGRLFGWSLAAERSEAYVYCFKEALSRRTHFFYCPEIVVSQPGSYTLAMDSLPPGSLVPHLDGDDRALIAMMPYGMGKVFHLSWDWNNAVPLGYSDGGWMTVLGAALAEAAWNPGTRLAWAGPQLRVSAPPFSTVRLDASVNFSHWTPLWSNSIPASGVLRLPMDFEGPQRFFRARD